MSHEKIKNLFMEAVGSVSSEISSYAIHPEKDFTRNKKLSADKLISFMVSCGSSSIKIELLDFFGMDTQAPSSSAFNQQREKLAPEALEAVFHRFNHSLPNVDKTSSYRFFAADGSTFTFFSKPSFASEEYHVSEGHSAKGFYSMHLNAFYDLQKHTYSDALIQSVHCKNEFSAFCDMVDRHQTTEDKKDVFFGDRGYCSYNNLAHVLEKGQYFLFRTKDTDSKGLVGNFTLPQEDSFDIRVNVTLVRSHKKKIVIRDGFYKCYVDTNTTFDYLVHGSLDTYSLSFRIVRFPISEDTYKCIVTKKDSIDVMNLLCKELIPIRSKRQYPRLKTAHFRRPRYFIYRAA